jgi:dipicolinate synthase subunit A
VLGIRALSGRLSGFGLVFNTVPEVVLGEELALQLSEDCLCIDLASRKGIELPEGEQCIWARGLPGKMAPKVAALTLWKTVEHILAEQRGEYA